MSVTKDAADYLSPDEAAAAYIAKTPMEFSSKRNRVENGGNGEGWIDVNEMISTFWENFASGKFDFRLKPEHVYKRGDAVRVRKVSNDKGRKHGAFAPNKGAFFAIVHGPYGDDADGDFNLIDGSGSCQITNRSDFEPVNIE